MAQQASLNTMLHMPDNLSSTLQIHIKVEGELKTECSPLTPICAQFLVFTPHMYTQKKITNSFRKIISYRHVQSPISQVILYFVKLTINSPDPITTLPLVHLTLKHITFKP